MREKRLRWEGRELGDLQHRPRLSAPTTQELVVVREYRITLVRG
jgi:hypothetical protein